MPNGALCVADNCSNEEFFQWTVPISYRFIYINDFIESKYTYEDMKQK